MEIALEDPSLPFFLWNTERKGEQVTFFRMQLWCLYQLDHDRKPSLGITDAQGASAKYSMFFFQKCRCIVDLGAPKRKRRNARSGSHDTIAGPERNWKGWCFGVMINTYAFTGPRKTHPQVGQYVFPIFHCTGVGCVYISSENAFDKSALLVDRNKLKIQVKTNSSTNYYYYYYYY